MRIMAHTYTSDVQVLIQFAKDQGFDLLEVMESVSRLESAIDADLIDYSFPVDGDSDCKITYTGIGAGTTE